jgi:hypothetical protein
MNNKKYGFKKHGNKDKPLTAERIHDNVINTLQKHNLSPHNTPMSLYLKLTGDIKVRAYLHKVICNNPYITSSCFVYPFFKAIDHKDDLLRRVAEIWE